MRTTTELRDEILTAARAEFAQYGLAGARIDRIARSASASKERLYAHFGDKETLFRDVVAMREVDDLSYEEIALATGISIGTVRSRLSRARARLKEALRPALSGATAA